MKKILCFILVFTTLLGLVACSGKGSTNSDPVVTVANGKYKEIDITPPDVGYPLGIFSREDGSIDFLCQKSQIDPFISIEERGISHFMLPNGGAEWVKQDTPWVDELAKNYPKGEGYVQLNFYFDNGTLWVSASKGNSLDGKQLQEEYGIYSLQDNKLNKVGFVSENEANEGYYYFISMDKDFIVISSNDMITYCINRKGELLGKYENASIDRSAVLIEGQLVWPNGEGIGKSLVLNLPNFKVTKQINTVDSTQSYGKENAFYLMNSGYTIDPNNMQQVTTDKSIYRYTIEGSTVELLLKGDDYSFGSHDFFCEFMTMGKNESFFVVGSNASSFYVLQYVYDENIPLQGNETLSIFSLYDSPTIRHAVGVWARSHPDISIDYIVGITDSASALTEKDYISQLITELVAGQGPDILVLDGLPIERIISQGYLQDMNNLISTDDIFSSAISSFGSSESLFAIPTRMKVSILGSDNASLQNQLNTLQMVADFVEKNPSSKDTPPNESNPEVAIVYPSAEVVFETWYPVYASTIWKNNSLDTNKLSEFLKQTGRIVSHNNLSTVEQHINSSIASNDDDVVVNVDTKFISEDNSPTIFYNNGCQIFTNVPFNTTSFLNGFGEWSGKTTGWVSPLKGNDDGYFVPTCIVGIVNGAPERSSDFIEVLLSESVQEANTLDGSPVRISTFNRLLNAHAEKQNIKITNDISSFIKELKPVVIHSVPYNAVKDAALRYYIGEISLDEACSAVYSNASIWLAEQKS